MGIVYFVLTALCIIVYGVVLMGLETVIRILSHPIDSILAVTSFILTPFDPVLRPLGRMVTFAFLTAPWTFIGWLDGLFVDRSGPEVVPVVDGYAPVPYTADDYYE